MSAMRILAVLTVCLVVFSNLVSAEESFKDAIILERPPQCRKYKTLLSLDGGGMKGLITTMVLQRLSRDIKSYYLDHPEILAEEDMDFARIVTVRDFDIDLADYFDLISGISAGSWMTTYLVTKGGQVPSRNSVEPRNASQEIFDLPMIVKKYGHIRAGNPKGLEVFFMEFGVHIYPPRVIPFTYKFRTAALPIPKIPQFTVPKYTPDGLEWTLFQFLGDIKLSEVYTSVLIGAFDLNQRAAIQFTAFPDTDVPEEKDKNKQKKKVMKTSTNVVWTRSIAPDYSQTSDTNARNVKELPGLDYEIRHITRASSAFPMIHGAKVLKPIKDLRNEFQLVDGAMVGNNPTLMAIIAMTEEFNCTVSDIAAISIGTGTVSGDNTKIGNGGALQWMAPMISLLLDSSTEFIQSNLDFLYYSALSDTKPNQYLRIQTAGDVTERKGQVLSNIDVIPDLPALRQIGVDASILYHSNLRMFVSSFIFEGDNPGECGIAPGEVVPKPPTPSPSPVSSPVKTSPVSSPKETKSESPSPEPTPAASPKQPRSNSSAPETSPPEPSPVFPPAQPTSTPSPKAAEPPPAAPASIPSPKTVEPPPAAPEEEESTTGGGQKGGGRPGRQRGKPGAPPLSTDSETQSGPTVIV